MLTRKIIVVKRISSKKNNDTFSEKIKKRAGARLGIVWIMGSKNSLALGSNLSRDDFLIKIPVENV